MVPTALEISPQSPPDAAYAPGAGEREVIVIFVELAQTLGLPKSLGEIYGLLYAVPRPLAFGEIADLLDLSRGSVSQGLRFLRNVGAVRPVVVPGDRREYFEAEVELRKLVAGFIRETMQPGLDRWGQRNAGLAADQFSLSPDHAEAVETRLTKLRKWHRSASTVLPTLGKLLG